MSAYYEQRRKIIYRVLKKSIYEFARINDPVYGCEKDSVVATDEENPKIVLLKGEIDKIVSFFCHTYNREGARKIQPRIKRFYTGISSKRIQKRLSSNENHFKINPIFSKKLPLFPVFKFNLNLITFFHCWTYSHGFRNLDHYPAKIPTKY